ncbi:MAG TPA: class I SAM-dependent methyltransferase [Thermoleophilaceae bacterium]|nr:class I SAM-dependent methyltransferase [Thermoleophilaceae bacterium]
MGLGVNLRERRRFYKNRTMRELVEALRWVVLRRDAPDIAHIAFYDEITEGPVQRDEALFLHGLVRVIRPATVVEIGFYHGVSAYNFLSAMDADARLYAFDVDPICDEVARRRFGHEPRLVFRRRAQQDLTPDDVDGRPVDLVFVDGAHDLELNRRTFERLLGMLAPGAVVAIHDTGTVARRWTPDSLQRQIPPERWIGDSYEHQPGERAFVNWVLDEHPEFAQIHLHTDRTPRAGLTLLQRSGPLPRPAASPP